MLQILGSITNKSNIIDEPLGMSPLILRGLLEDSPPDLLSAFLLRYFRK